MVSNILAGGLAFLSIGISLWQWAVARRFPLHARLANPTFAPPVTLLKPLLGADAETRVCLESWFRQDYPGPIQLLFGVVSPDDPAAAVVHQLIAANPDRGAELLVCGESLGANGKMSTLAQLQRHAHHDLLVISDADVCVPSDFLINLVAPLQNHAVGLVNCFYCLGNPSTFAMRCEAIAINADFWSQVLQAQSLKPLDFALGAVIATRRAELDTIGGFASLANYLADDYELGNRIAQRGRRIVISPVVAECREAPRNWREVWTHQLRWARTIRACRPVAHFFSVLGNATLWSLLWVLVSVSSVRLSGNAFPGGASFSVILPPAVTAYVAFLAIRVSIAVNLQSRLTRSRTHYRDAWLVPVKDLLAVSIWGVSFLVNRVEWRERCYLVLPGGELTTVTHRKDKTGATPV